MMGMQVRSKMKPERVEKAAQKANFENLGHAAASISKDAKKSITKAPQDEPSLPGEPPHTHRRVFYRRAIGYDVDRKKQEAVIGFRHSVIGEAGALHEFGLVDDEGREFPERPTIGPALDRAQPRIANQWAGTIGRT